jgi:hypothetical protein
LTKGIIFGRIIFLDIGRETLYLKTSAFGTFQVGKNIPESPHHFPNLKRFFIIIVSTNSARKFHDLQNPSLEIADRQLFPKEIVIFQ